MPSIQHVLSVVESIAPPEFAFSFDKVGLQVGDLAAEATGALVSLDRSIAAIRACASAKANLLVTHHPLIWEPMTSVLESDPVGLSVRELIRNGISHVVAHTNWDCAVGGVNDALAACLGLVELSPFGSHADIPWRRLIVFCPEGIESAIVDAAAKAGAGRYGNYSECAFTSSGESSWRAGVGSRPAVGKEGQPHQGREVRIEMGFPASAWSSVEAAIRAAHPYEEPVIESLSCDSRAGHPAGRRGRLSTPLSCAEFQGFVDQKLGTRSTVWKASSRDIEWVGVVGGAADDDWRAALAAGCDAFVTGEVKQHNALDATTAGLSMVSAGHYATEQPGVVALADVLRDKLPEIPWKVFEPEPGLFGRPL